MELDATQLENLRRIGVGYIEDESVSDLFDTIDALRSRITAALAIGPVRADDIGSDGARVGTRGAAVCFDYREAVRAALAEPVGEPPRPLEHTPFAMPDGAERCAADGLAWPCPEVVGDPQPSACAMCGGPLMRWMREERQDSCPSCTPPEAP